jgi:hypothetical protein
MNHSLNKQNTQFASVTSHANCVLIGESDVLLSTYVYKWQMAVNIYQFYRHLMSTLIGNALSWKRYDPHHTK